ncbi:MAG: DsbA family protein [Hyphomicrobiaceae bacterium]
MTAGSISLVAQGATSAPEVSVEELMKTHGLTDMALGPADAKVTVVEYASLTCGHCGRFHKSVFPKIKEKYIDTGKIRFIIREFPLDNLAAAASMLTRCAGDDKSYPLVDTLFTRQEDWAYVKGNPVPALFEISKQAGFTKEKFDSCLKDQKLLEKLTAQRTRAAEVFGVDATPTFFINGKRLSGGVTIKKFEEILDPLLAEG